MSSSLTHSLPHRKIQRFILPIGQGFGLYPTKNHVQVYSLYRPSRLFLWGRDNFWMRRTLGRENTDEAWKKPCLSPVVTARSSFQTQPP